MTLEKVLGNLMIEQISMQDHLVHESLIDLNNKNARETSFLTYADWENRVKEAFAAIFLSGPTALLIALDQEANYFSPNFLWFRERFTRFVYIDRIVVADEYRSQGLARYLYLELFNKAKKAGYRHVFCEVNTVPPNPGSMAFHKKMGFLEVGTGRFPEKEKAVTYLSKNLC